MSDISTTTVAVHDGAGGLNSLFLAGPPERTRVVVAMSGGVDSSVVAAMLSREGYEVIGITMQLYDHGEATGRTGSCCAGRDIHDARRVAAAIGIPHYVLDYERRFHDAVIRDFADSYASGETPIPCVQCNQSVKFTDLFHRAKDLGADAMATGHYIANRPGPHGWQLHRGRDADRDQSYFLFATTPEQLKFLRFPLGEMRKEEVRELAREWNLPVAQKADSQDICFVPSGRYTRIVERLRPGAAEPGDIVHIDGRKLGRHDGIINFTIGQRRGIGVPGPEPLYVVRLDAERGEVIVGPREALRTHWISLREVNWLGDDPLSSGAQRRIHAKVRSTRAPQPAELHIGEGKTRVRLIDGEDGVSPGQACVFYEGADPGARVLGGGWIDAGEPAAST
jgi:tRNA-specific 2-thiouridylase